MRIENEGIEKARRAAPTARLRRVGVVVAVLVLSLAACSDRVDRRAMAGMAIGAAVGGLIGAGFGEGSFARTLYTGAGVLVGAATGVGLVRLLGGDRVAMEDTARRAVAEAPSGTIVNWSNPETGTHGFVRPLNGYQLANGTPCRDFRATAVVGDGIGSGSGIACRDPRGQWQLVSNTLGG